MRIVICPLSPSPLFLLVATTAVSVGWALHASRLASDIQEAWDASDRAHRRAQDVQRAWNESESERAGRTVHIGNAPHTWSDMCAVTTRYVR